MDGFGCTMGRGTLLCKSYFKIRKTKSPMQKRGCHCVAHTHTRTCTHIHVQIQEEYVPALNELGYLRINCWDSQLSSNKISI